MKISKLLPIALAMALGTSGVFAAGGTDTTNSAVSTFNLTLADYVKITTDAQSKTSTTTYTTDYKGIRIDTAMAVTFKIISNNREEEFYLIGTCPVAGGADATEKALYGANADCTRANLVFTKTDNPPADTSVSDITGGTPTLANNTDAVAFGMTIAPSHAEGATESPLTAEWDTDYSAIKYTMKNGVGTFLCTINGNNVANTFDTHDTDGTYQAKLTMTRTAF